MIEMLFKSLSLPLSEFKTNSLMERKLKNLFIVFFLRLLKSAKILDISVLYYKSNIKGCLRRSDNVNICP